MRGSAILNFDLTSSIQTGVGYAAAAAQNVDASIPPISEVQFPRTNVAAAPALSVHKRIGSPGHKREASSRAEIVEAISNS